MSLGFTDGAYNLASGTRGAVVRFGPNLIGELVGVQV